MSRKLQSVAKALRNPAVQRILAWALPIIIGWILSRFDKKSKDKHKK